MPRGRSRTDEPGRAGAGYVLSVHIEWIHDARVQPSSHRPTGLEAGRSDSLAEHRDLSSRSVCLEWELPDRPEDYVYGVNTARGSAYGCEACDQRCARSAHGVSSGLISLDSRTHPNGSVPAAKQLGTNSWTGH
jgi:hypothetical protein